MSRYARETEAIEVRISRTRRRRELVGDAVSEARRSLRGLGRSRGFTVAAVLVLGVGMGATVAMYALVDAVVLRPLAYPAPSGLVWVSSSVAGPGMTAEWGLSEAGYHEYRAESRSLAGLGVYWTPPWSGGLSGDGGEAERVTVASVSASVLMVLGATPAVGRIIGESDDRPGGPSVVMLSHPLWRRRYGGDAGIVGRSILLDTRPVEVIGVLAEGLTLPGVSADVLVPLQLDPAAQPVNSHHLQAVARLAPGQTPESARRELGRLTARFPERFPEAYSPSFMSEFRFTANVVPLRDRVLGSTGRMLWVLLGGVFLLLVIAAANVGNLFLVRADVRQREMSVRAALGARRWHVLWHHLTESLLISALAGLVAALLAWALLRLMPALLPPNLPRLENVRLGVTAVALVAALSVVTGLLFGIAPAMRRLDAGRILNETGRGVSASRRQHAARRLLVAGQVALAVLLLSGAGLMLRSVERLRAVEPGFEPAGVVTVSIVLPAARYGTWDLVNGFHRDLLGRLGALPGVAGAALTTVLPVRESGSCASVFAEGLPVRPGEQPPCVSRALVSPGYFEVMRIEVEGRAPTWGDNDSNSGAVVVSRALAERFWPGASAIGRGVRPGGDTPPFYRIAGVTADVRAEGLDEDPTEMVYYPLRPIPGSNLWSSPRAVTIVLRTSSARPLAVLPAVRRVLAEMDPDVPVATVQTMEDVLSDSMARRSFAMQLLALAAGMALVLSAIGIYGVVSTIVTQRRGDIGVRMALGARAPQVRGQMLLQGLAMGGAGVAAGLAAALLVNRALGSLLFGVGPSDPLTLGAVSVAMLLLVALAGYGPARRAARVDPVEALRPE